jgi:GNAT superfamily N-acetyltransferase
MRIEVFDPAVDTDKVKACYQLYIAGKPVDDPDGPTMSAPVYSGWFVHGWDGSPREAALAASGDDEACVGAYVLQLPDKENTHLGRLTILVAPDQRRSGHGAELLQHAASRAADLGRTLLSGETRIGSPGTPFAAAIGARPELLEVRRVLELADIPAGRLAELRGRAEEAARGYSLIYWQGPTPEEHIDQVATVVSAMADAPHSPGEEAHGSDAQRVRESDRRAAEQGVRRYSVAASCDRTGELAGLTQIGVDSTDPSWGFQFVTAVTRAHRGHRLGLLIKVAMLDRLATAEPGIRHIQTGNADSNQYMIAINAELGYKVLDEWRTWELDVAAVPAAISRVSRPGGAVR